MVVTDDVQDLAGNRLADFSSQFTVEPAIDLTRPQVVTVRPPSGATGVPPNSSVVLFFSEPINPATAPGAILIAQEAEGFLKSAEVKQQLVNLGINPIGRGSLDELQAFVKAEEIDGIDGTHSEIGKD